VAKILLIETSTRVCSVAVAENGITLAIKESQTRNSHAELITLFVQEVLKNANIAFADLDAVAVSKGPGSYTGLRIGVSTAKGFCYALDIPLLSVSTLKALAYGKLQQLKESGTTFEDSFFIPMIDARRMEVYTSIYDSGLKEVEKVTAKIIDNTSFSKILNTGKKVYFLGDGALKCQPFFKNINNAVFDKKEFLPSANYMAAIAEEKFQQQQFEDVAYFEPFYLKDFIPGISRVKGLR